MSIPRLIMDHMRPLAIVFLLLAVALCGCAEELNTPTPTPGPIPTLEPLPTAEPPSTPPPLPTVPQSPVPPAAGDPIIGTWALHGENNSVTVYSFNPDGTFLRRDEGAGMVTLTGIWARESGPTYQLIYDEPGNVTEQVTYAPSIARLSGGQGYFERIS